MSVFCNFYKKENLVTRTIDIDEKLYLELEKLSSFTYDASISKMVNVCIEELIKTEKVQLYKRESLSYVSRSFVIRNSFWKGLEKLKAKYGISIRLLVNIAIHNALIEEGVIDDKCI